jgi:hypothetical protein
LAYLGRVDTCHTHFVRLLEPSARKRVAVVEAACHRTDHVARALGPTRTRGNQHGKSGAREEPLENAFFDVHSCDSTTLFAEEFVLQPICEWVTKIPIGA